MREEEDGTVLGGGYCDEYGNPMCTDKGIYDDHSHIRTIISGFSIKLDGQDSEYHNVHKCVQDK
jgi:hypothetical protein